MKYYRSYLALLLVPIIAALSFALIFLFANPTEPIPSLEAAVKGTLGFAAAVLILGAYPATIAVGLPFFAVLIWARVRATPWLCGVIGATVAAAPAILLAGLLLENWVLTVVAIGVGAGAGWLFWFIAGDEINRAVRRNDS